MRRSSLPVLLLAVPAVSAWGNSRTPVGPSLRVIRSHLGRLRGVPTIILDAKERIAGNERRGRSIHMFRRGAELVVDEYAPRDTFTTVDRPAFSPLSRSLTLLTVPGA